MAKQKSYTERVADLMRRPTVYVFNFKDVPIEKYDQALRVLFNDPDFSEAVEKRNRLVKSSDRLRRGSSEIANMVRTIQQHDRRLADTLYAAFVQANLHSDEELQFMSFSTLLKYYVDYSRPNIKQTVARLVANLDKLTFLSDMLESLVTDIKADMREVFDGKQEFSQFDAVSQVLTQLRGFFSNVRSKEANSPDADLYMEYADSINDYLCKRLKTYSEKYHKLHPAPKGYTAQELIDGLYKFFGKSPTFDESCLKRTDMGGWYINILAVLPHLDKDMVAKIDKQVKRDKRNDTTDALMKYCFDATDVIMAQYVPQK